MSRQIKDIKDKNTGNLVYPRTHVKAIVVDENTNLEDLIDVNVGNRLDTLESTIKTDGTGNLYLSDDGFYKEVAAKSLKFENITASSWIDDSTYVDFGYRCDLPCPGVTADMYAEVVFNVAQATSGQYAPICETSTDIVSIWSANDSIIVIPTIIISR